MRDSTDLPILLFLLSIAASPAHAQKCQATLTGGAPFLAPRDFTIKLNKPIGKYGDIVRVDNEGGVPSAISFEVNPGFSDSYEVPIANTIATTKAFIDGQCKDGYSFQPSFRRPSPPAMPRVSSPRVVSGSAAFGQAPQAIVDGDFNGDGTVDHAEADSTSIAVTLYDAGNNPIATHTYALPSTTEPSLVAADFNHDGHLDLAVLLDPVNGSKTSSIALLLGNGDGTFQAPSIIAAGIPAYFLVTADFNGDGLPDFGVNGGTQFATLLNKGGATFGSPVLTTVVAGGRSFVAVDLTGDGRVDLMMTGGDKVDVYPGNGDGTFQPKIETITGGISGAFVYLAYADLNHDGKLDYLVANGVNSGLYVAFGNGDGTFGAATAYTVPANVGPVGVIPLGDGNTAFVMGDYFAQSLVYFFANSSGAVGLPSFEAIGTATAEYQPALSTADLNGDGKPDLVAALATGISVLLGQGKGVFASPVSYPTTGVPNSVALLDLNGDGKPDMVATNPTGADVFLNNGDGTFHAGTSLAGTTWTLTAVADFNGDGKPDLAVLSTAAAYTGATTSTIEILLSKGNGTFASPITVSVSGPGGTGLFAGDFNNDGKPDLIVGYTDASGFTFISALYPGKGDGTFGSPTVLPVTAAPLAVADLNHDGNLDVIAGSYFTGEVDLLLGQGNGNFQTQTLAATSISSAIVTDLNSDGKLDIVFGDCCGVAEASYMLGNGDGTFSSQTFFLSGPNPNSIVAGNFMGNAQPSLAIAGQFGYGTDTPTLTIEAVPFSPCDINRNGNNNVVDVQEMINEALGKVSPANDLNGDGAVNVVDIQIEMNAALNLGCAATAQ